MNLTTINGHVEALVAKTAGSVAKGALIQFASDLADGEVVTVNKSNIVVDATDIASAGLFRLVTNRNGVLRYSDFFDASTIKSKTSKSYAAPTYTSMTIGWNGTSGNMDTTADRALTVRIYDNSKERLFQTRDEVSLAEIVIKDSATEASVASELFDAIANNSKRGEAFVNVSMILDGTLLTGAAAKVSNGSKLVTFATAVASIAVGDYLVLNGAYYLVTGLANSNKNVTIKTAYQGASGAIAVGDVKRVTKADAATAEAGVKITAVKREYFRTGKTSAITFDFDLGISGFEVATVTKLAKTSQGSGTARQIAELEWFTEGNQGYPHRLEGALGEAPDFIPSVDMTKTYSQTIVVFNTQSANTIIGGAPKFDNQLTLAVPTGVTCLAAVALAAL